MPNGHDTSRKYDGHKYDDDHDHTSDCHHGCGCSMGPSRSSGPLGLDPHGECPGNPVEESLGGNADYEIVVERRINNLTQRAYKAEDLLKRVEPGVVEFAEQLSEAKQQLNSSEQRATRAIELLTPSPKAK